MRQTQTARSSRGASAVALLAAAGALAVGVAPQSPSAEAILTRLAIETAADGDLAPIEHPPGPNAQFALYDRFRLVSLAARAALRDGKPLDPAALPSSLTSPRLVVLAFARSPLGDEPGRPAAIEIRSGDGRQIKRLGTLGPREIVSTLPGVVVQPQTLVVAFALASLRPSDRVTIVFNESPAAADVRTPGVMTPRQFSGSVPFIAPKAIDTAGAAAIRRRAAVEPGRRSRRGRARSDRSSALRARSQWTRRVAGRGGRGGGLLAILARAHGRRPRAAGHAETVTFGPKAQSGSSVLK